MVHARVLDEYIHFEFIYTTDYIFLVITIKHLVNQYGEPNTPHKLENGKKPSSSNMHVLFFPFVVQKATVHVDSNALNMCHQSQKDFWVS